MAQKNDETFKSIQMRQNVENEEARRQFRVNDLRDETNKAKFEDLDGDIDDAFTRMDEMDKKEEERVNNLSNKFEDKFQLLQN